MYSYCEHLLLCNYVILTLQVSCMRDVTLMSLAAAVAHRTGSLRVFERGENLLQNGILHFVFKLSQSTVKLIANRNRVAKLEFTQRGLIRTSSNLEMSDFAIFSYLPSKFKLFFSKFLNTTSLFVLP